MSSLTGVLRVGSALRSPTEEFVGALTHGVGLVLSIVGGIALVAVALNGGDLKCIGGCGFYAVTLVAVYAASTLSHIYLPEQANRLFRRLDQGFIYLLIVGTFTPFAVTYLRSPVWLGFYTLILAVALLGFASKSMFAHRLNKVSVALYLLLGWGEAIAMQPLVGVLPTVCIVWVVAGGLFYTLGTAFLVLDIRRYHFHAIWHLFVLAGSACHYVAVLRFVAMQA